MIYLLIIMRFTEKIEFENCAHYPHNTINESRLTVFQEIGSFGGSIL